MTAIHFWRIPPVARTTQQPERRPRARTSAMMGGNAVKGVTMSRIWSSLRRRILTPSVAATRLDKRGFRAKDDAARALLETVGRYFLAGFGHAAASDAPADAAARLEDIEPAFRGFAYEGAGMGFGILDGLGLGGGDSARRFIEGPAAHHVYMATIGVGWAMARLPRPRWRAVAPTDPLLRWLALDGYGFHQAYFHTDRYVYRQYRRPSFPWPPEDRGSYANRVIDQGIGRALWFVEGADVPRVVARIEQFAPDRRGDLYSGAGLAATYAGGVDDSELQAFWQHAGEHRAAVAQAGAFAAKARVLAGLVTSHTGRATSIFCGTGPEQAAAATDRALADLPPDGSVPAFEIWRRRIAAELCSKHPSSTHPSMF
jgi:hypothetical protein